MGDVGSQKLLGLILNAVLSNAERQRGTLLRACTEAPAHAFGAGPKSTFSAAKAGRATGRRGLRSRVPSGNAHEAEPAGVAVRRQDLAPTDEDGEFDPRRALKWQPHHIEVLIRLVRSSPPGGRLPVTDAINELGLERVPDPDHLLRQRVYMRMAKLRTDLRHGEDPLSGCKRPSAVPPRTYNWRAWLQRAFLALPGQRGTLNDAAAIIEADPEIAPKLDWRVARATLATPLWKDNLRFYARRYPEFVNTGDKRGRETVYTYDEQQCIQPEPKTPQPGSKAPKRGAPAPPRKGKRSKRSG